MKWLVSYPVVMKCLYSFLETKNVPDFKKGLVLKLVNESTFKNGESTLGICGSIPRLRAVSISSSL